MKSLLKENGQISILDYNHQKIEWNPETPKSMKEFYDVFFTMKKRCRNEQCL